MIKNEIKIGFVYNYQSWVKSDLTVNIYNSSLRWLISAVGIERKIDHWGGGGWRKCKNLLQSKVQLADYINKVSHVDCKQRAHVRTILYLKYIHVIRIINYQHATITDIGYLISIFFFIIRPRANVPYLISNLSCIYNASKRTRVFQRLYCT